CYGAPPGITLQISSASVQGCWFATRTHRYTAGLCVPDSGEMSMLQRLLFGLITVTSLTLVGCANSPQQLSPQRKLTTQLAPVGQGQPVVVKVVDGRASQTLGTRGGLYPETSAITVASADIVPKLQAQAEAA